MRAVLTISLLLVLATSSACGAGYAEAAHAGHVLIVVGTGPGCRRGQPWRRCRAAPLPRWTFVRAEPLDGDNAPATLGITRRLHTAGDALEAGRWRLSVPRLERPGCRPRITLDVEPAAGYWGLLIFHRRGACSAHRLPLPPHPPSVSW